MSQFQQLVLNSTEQTNPAQSLTGCVYHVIQGVGLPGQNVLKLIPVSKPASNLIPVFQQPVISGISAQKLAVLPPVLSNSTLPTPVTLPVLQQPAFGNYIITANNSLPESAKTLRVEQTSPLQNATVFLEKPHVTVPSSFPQTAAPTFVMVKPTPPVVTVNSPPMLPSGHHLQIPANAEVKSVPASSLPIAIQQKIITAASRGDVNRNPSVIYVSPVNTVRTLAAKPLSPLSPKTNTTTPAPVGVMVPAPKPFQSTAEAPNAPMKWIVQQNTESAACLVPVKSSNDTASKILKLLSGAQNDQNNLANVLPVSNSPASSTTKAINIKDNALVMYNNKIYLLAKRGSEVFDSEAKQPASSSQVSPEKLVSSPDKDISNKVVEVVLSKNKTSGTYVNQQISSTAENTTQNLNIKQTFTPKPLQGNRAMTNGISVNNDSIKEKHLIIPRSPQQDRIYTPPKQTPAINMNCVKDEPEDPVPIAQTNQVQRLTIPVVKREKTITPITPCSDNNLRRKFGLIKKEKVILRRLPLLQAQTSSKVAVEEHVMKRKSASPDPAHQLKRRKSLDESVLRQDFAPVQSNNSNSLSSATSRPLSAGSLRAASVPPVTVGSVSSLLLTSNTPANPSVQIKNPNPSSNPPEQSHSDESSSQSNSEPAPPGQYFPTVAPVYFEDTVRDEKIRRLKELLKEREQELEAIRTQMRT